jgi:hypothetical protein
MSKLPIQDDAPFGTPLHTNLEVVVDYLLLNGNALAHSYRWGSNREGFFCHLTGPIDFDGLASQFEFPKTIILGRERNLIYCQKTGCLIQTLIDSR